MQLLNIARHRQKFSPGFFRDGIARLGEESLAPGA